MGRRIAIVLLVAAIAAAGWPAATSGQAKVAMTFWSWRGEDRAFYEAMIKTFEAQNP